MGLRGFCSGTALQGLTFCSEDNGEKSGEGKAEGCWGVPPAVLGYPSPIPLDGRTATLREASPTELQPALWFLLEGGNGERWKRWGTCSRCPAALPCVKRSRSFSRLADSGLCMLYDIDRRVQCPRRAQGGILSALAFCADIP